jgi:uncharacterized OB-fold protein
MADRTEVLTAPLIIEYPFSRTTGPVIGAFLTGLREQVIVGTKTSDGRVLVPPMEYDPTTGKAAIEMVEVGPGGTVTTWAWVNQPRPKDPFDHPFAWALIRIDGAESALLHAVDVGDISRMTTGMHVTPRWRAEREGHINDIECFVPDGEN